MIWNTHAISSLNINKHLLHILKVRSTVDRLYMIIINIIYKYPVFLNEHIYFLEYRRFSGIYLVNNINQ